MKTRFSTIVFVFFALMLISSSSLVAQHSVARQWNDVLLEAIRNDFARPTVHARNLFHSSAGMYDAWAVYQEEAETFFLGKTLGDYTCPFDGIGMPTDIESARNEAISFVAYRLLKHRFENSPGADVTLPEIEQLMTDLGYDGTNVSTDYATDGAAALGNYIASNLIAFGLGDGSNEVNDYENQFYEAVNPPLAPNLNGNPDIEDPNRWQPLAFDVFIDQSGNIFIGNVPLFLSPEWGAVTPFALSQDDATIFQRDGFDYKVYHDPGPPPELDTLNGTGLSDEYEWGNSLVSVWSSHMSPDDNVLWDISPASIGNVPIEAYPTDIPGLRDFYDLANGGDPGEGHDLNPVTQAPYAPQIVKRGDYARILAEFWADGPDSETPPGHWFTLLNYVSDHDLLVKQFNGQGDILSDLEWDVKTYLAMGGAMHDAAVTAWGIKGRYDYVRPISAIRKMADLGQSSNPELPSYHPAGMPLVDGKIELVQEGDPLEGFFQQHVGKIKLLAWRGPDYVTIPEIQEAGVGWILAENWWPYQRPSFVTPNFAGYISGHSTFSRAAAEIMTSLTGDAFFPGGMGEFLAEQNEFLVFEDGPSENITLQWATYRDASDQCSLSRIWGGIHPPVDDIPGRLIGIEIGNDAFDLVQSLFYRDIDQDGFYSYEDCNDNDANEFPGQQWYVDADGDGYSSGEMIVICARPISGFLATELTQIDGDCNDSNADEFPGQQWYVDADFDGYSSGELIVSCNRPSMSFLSTELLETEGDCNDSNADEFPGQEWYVDADGDGYSSGELLIECGRPASSFLSSELTQTEGDCNDSNADEFPGQEWYVDADGDGYSSGELLIECERPTSSFIASELTQIDGDCDDMDANEFPGQEWYVDADGDGYSSGELLIECERPTSSFIASELTQTDGDCDDMDANEFPGQIWYLDNDEDGYGDGSTVTECVRPISGYLESELTQSTSDCDNFNPTVYFGADEICDGLDNDCNGEIDEDLFLYTYYKDVDGDGFGDIEKSLDTCVQIAPLDYVDNADDCDDTNSGIFPNATEIADNGVDEDCSGIDLFQETKIFPNPVRDELTVHFVYEGDLDVVFHNNQGQLVTKQTIKVEDNQLMVSVANFSPGVYILQLLNSDGESLLLHRIIKH